MRKKKTPEVIEIPKDQALSARRRARAVVGVVKPGKVMVPKKLRPPKHKSRPGEGED
jgi:hypothetical protein